MHRWFEIFILLLITLNVLSMCFIVYEPPWLRGANGGGGGVAEVVTFFSTFFSIMFMGEAALKLVALGPRGYLAVSWNIFDFLLCVISIVDIALPDPVAGSSAGSGPGVDDPAGGGGGFSFNPLLLRVLRMFRILRLIRLVRSAKGLRTLLHTVMACAPSIAIICALLAIVCILFATVGMALFGNVIPQPHYGYGGDGPSFDTFGGAMLLMAVMATSEQWPSLMRACAVQPPFCGPQAGTPPGAPYDCAPEPLVTVAFFVLYQARALHAPAPLPCFLHLASTPRSLEYLADTPYSQPR